MPNTTLTDRAGTEEATQEVVASNTNTNTWSPALPNRDLVRPYRLHLWWSNLLQAAHQNARGLTGDEALRAVMRASRMERIRENCEAMWIDRRQPARRLHSRQMLRIAGRTLARMLALNANSEYYDHYDDIDLLNIALDIWSHCQPRDISRVANKLEYLFNSLGVDLVWCADCGRPAYGPDAIWSNSHDGPVCESCGDDLVWCEDAEGHYSADEVTWAYTAVRNGIPVTPQAFRFTSRLTPLANRHSDYAHDFVHNSITDYLGWVDYGDGLEPIDYDRETVCDDDDDDDVLRLSGEHSEVRLGVHLYHRHPLRHTSWYFEEPTLAARTNPPIGAELEVYCENNVPSVLRGCGLNWIVETDGSLDGAHGVEIVTPPMTREQWDGTIPRLFSALKDAGTLAYSAPNGQYGLHLTIARKYLTPLQEARMSLFLTAEENLAFVMAIAQRRAIYLAHIDIGGLPVYSQKCATLGGISREWREVEGMLKHVPSGLVGPGKCTPLNLKPGLAEFRIFQGSINADTFRKNLEFVWALMHWTRPECATGSRWRHQDFCLWLSNNRDEYPTLVAYLERAEYRVKAGRGPIPNSWRHLLAKSTTHGKPAVFAETMEDEGDES